MKLTKAANQFTQLCVWPGTNLGDSTAAEFVKYMRDEFGVRVQFAEVVTTLPDLNSLGMKVMGTGGRTDLFFFIHTADVSKFAAPRLAYGIRWWEDVFANRGAEIYPKQIHDKYPRTWDATIETE